jgi:hypothetical protein
MNGQFDRKNSPQGQIFVSTRHKKGEHGGSPLQNNLKNRYRDWNWRGENFFIPAFSPVSGAFFQPRGDSNEFMQKFMRQQQV